MFTPRVCLACIDMAGTTVCADGVLEQAFAEAVDEIGLAPGTSAYERALTLVRDTVSESKVVAFRALVGGDANRADTLNATFERAYARIAAAGGVSGIPGAEAALRELRDADVAVCLVTGFSRSTQDAMLAALGWSDLIDLALVPAEAGRGRPFPDLVLTAVLRLGIDDVRSVAVVGDTQGDVLGGVRSGASIVAGVLTGVHDRATLVTAGATHILDSVADLPGLVLGAERGARQVVPVSTGWL